MDFCLASKYQCICIFFMWISISIQILGKNASIKSARKVCQQENKVKQLSEFYQNYILQQIQLESTDRKNCFIKQFIKWKRLGQLHLSPNGSYVSAFRSQFGIKYQEPLGLVALLLKCQQNVAKNNTVIGQSYPEGRFRQMVQGYQGQFISAVRFRLQKLRKFWGISAAFEPLSPNGQLMLGRCWFWFWCKRQDPIHHQGLPLSIIVHQQNVGDIQGTDSQWVGRKGESRRLQGFSITPRFDHPKLIYKAHLERIGDVAWVDQGNYVGTRGQSRRLEGFQIKLVGRDADKYDVIYRCHMARIGDSATYKNGEFCGTRGQSRRIQSIFVQVIKK